MLLLFKMWPHFPTLQAQTGAVHFCTGVVLRLKSKTLNRVKDGRMVSSLSSCYDDDVSCFSGICEAAEYEQSWSWGMVDWADRMSLHV